MAQRTSEDDTHSELFEIAFEDITAEHFQLFLSAYAALPTTVDNDHVPEDIISSIPDQDNNSTSAHYVESEEK